MAEEQPVEQQHDYRNAADEQCRDARGHTLLRPDDEAVAGTAEQYTAQDGAADVQTRKGPSLARAQKDIEDRPRHEKTNGTSEKGRNAADHERDAEESRPPDDVDSGEAQQDGSRVGTSVHGR